MAKWILYLSHVRQLLLNLRWLYRGSLVTQSEPINVLARILLATQQVRMSVLFVIKHIAYFSRCSSSGKRISQASFERCTGRQVSANIYDGGSVVVFKPTHMYIAHSRLLFPETWMCRFTRFHPFITHCHSSPSPCHTQPFPVLANCDLITSMLFM